MNPTLNPFPGAQPYGSGDRRRFFGREALSREVRDAILARRVLTLYGPSGAGKSSLLQAGVLPDLEEAQDMRLASVDAWPGQDIAVGGPVDWLRQKVLGALKVDPGGVKSLAEGLERVFRRSDRPVLVVLDQLEQLLINHSKAAILATIGEVAAAAGLAGVGLHIVLSLREDYLGRWRSLLGDAPTLAQHGFRLGRLSVQEMVGSIVRAAATGEPPQEWSPAQLHPLVEEMALPGQLESDEAEVEAAYVQIVARRVFDRGGPEHLELRAESILRDYLTDALDGLGELRAKAVELLETRLVTRSGARTPVTREAANDVVPDGEALDHILASLEEARVLRAQEHAGDRFFELGHDWLALAIAERRRVREEEQKAHQERLQREEEAREAEERRAMEQEEAARRDRERMQGRRFRISLAALVLLVAVAGLLTRQNQELSWAKKLAESSRLEAEKNETEAKKNEAQAMVAAGDAGLQSALARQRSREAERARASAERLSEELERRNGELNSSNVTYQAVAKLYQDQTVTLWEEIGKAERASSQAASASTLSTALRFASDEPRDPSRAAFAFSQIQDPKLIPGFADFAQYLLSQPIARWIHSEKSPTIGAAFFGNDLWLVRRNGRIYSFSIETGAAGASAENVCATSDVSVAHTLSDGFLVACSDGRLQVVEGREGAVPRPLGATNGRERILTLDAENGVVGAGGEHGGVYAGTLGGADPMSQIGTEAGPIAGVALNADGTGLAVAVAANGAGVVYDLTAQSPRRIPLAPTGSRAAFDVAWLPVVDGGEDVRPSVYEAAAFATSTGEILFGAVDGLRGLLRLPTQAGWARVVTSAHNGGIVAFENGGIVSFRDVKLQGPTSRMQTSVTTSRDIRTSPNVQPVRGVVAGEGGLFAAVRVGGGVEIHDRDGFLAEAVGHQATVRILVASPDNRWLLTSDESGHTRVWPFDRPAPPDNPDKLLGALVESRTGALGNPNTDPWDEPATQPTEGTSP